MGQLRPAPVAVVQARMTSTRLPGKVLAELAGVPALHLQLGRLAECRELAGVVVATSTDPSDDAVVAAAAAVSIRVVRGPLDDVLGRYAIAARELGAKGLVRLTADCPVIAPEVVDEVVRRWREGDERYVANVIEPRTYPVGMDTEVMDADALLAADAEATEAYDREHVTPWVRANPERFPQAAVRLDPPAADVRLTLDTPEDLEALRRVVELAGRDAGLEDLIAAARARA